jgi:hypothetical protein
MSLANQERRIPFVFIKENRTQFKLVRLGTHQSQPETANVKKLKVITTAGGSY